MYCMHCGAKMDDDATFCTSCGTKVENTQPAYGQQTQPPYPAQPPYTPAQPIYTQAGGAGQPPMPPVYGQPGGAGQPPYGGGVQGQPPRKKPGKGLWIGLGAALLVVILAIVLFVYPGVLVGNGGPLSGNTVQTRFVNDNAAVFTGAFSGLGDTAVSDMLTQSFDMSVDIDVDAGYGTESGSMDMAYDGQTLGIQIEGGGAESTVMLIEDVLYVSSYGSVYGIQFDEAGDLSKDMTLINRVNALLAGAKSGDNTVDWKKAAEMLVNSIDKGCFEKSGSTNTLTMDADDLINMLNTFSEKLQADEDLLESLESFLEDTTGDSVDIVDTLDEAVTMLEAAKDTVDPSLKWVVEYEKGKPVSMELTIEVSGQKVVVSFGYEKTGSAVDITFEMKAPDSSKVEGSMSYEKTKEGFEFSGELAAGGQSITFEGSAVKSNNDISGTLKVTVSGVTMSVDYDGTLSFGKPKEAVEDMFDIDTGDADVQDFSDIFGMYGMSLSGISGDFSDFVPNDIATTDWSTTSEAPAEATMSLDGTLWYCDGYYDGDMYVEGLAIYFSDGNVYFGQAGMSGDEILDIGLETYSGVPYTYDGWTIHLDAGDGNTADFYCDGYTIDSGDGTLYYLQY